MFNHLKIEVYIMEEKKKELEEVETEEEKDTGKIEFPISGIIVIGVLLVLMIVCMVLIKVL